MEDKVKLIAFYFPQYHTIPENDEFWGKGFTDWDNVKKAKPLFEGHYQPRVPLNKNYYNPLDPGVLKWQADLAKKYGVYGFCFYHYWFNGKKVLEKPAELFLNSKNIDFSFCFSWANEPWTRTWDGKNNEVLIPQGYEREVEWQDHFNYLLPFFKDKRYIKIDNKPVFIIYRTEIMSNVEEMMKFWDNLAKKQGFSGVYFLETLNGFQDRVYSTVSRGFVELQPSYADYKETIKVKEPAILKVLWRINKWRKNLFKKGREATVIKDATVKLDYDHIWQKILEQKTNISGKKRFLGAFVDWDNSPRRKKNSTIFIGVSPERFRFYFSEQVKKGKEINSEFLFINAWNEWAEGAYLEPDEKFGYRYLEVIKDTLELKKYEK